MTDSLGRDLVFISFCNFSLSGNKPDATTLGRFRAKPSKENLFDSLLGSINGMLEFYQLKFANGKQVATDATSLFM